MSMQDTSQGTTADTGQGFTGSDTNQPGSEAPPVGENGLGQTEEVDSPFLANIPDHDRPVLAKYIKQWEANVTRRQMEQAAKYKPYEQLGDLQQVQRAVQFIQHIQDPNNLRSFYDRLHQQFGQQAQTQPPMGQGQGFEDDPVLQALNERFDKFQTEFQQRDQVLNAVAQFIIQQHQTAQEKEQDAALDNYLSQLKTEFGDFDEEYVLIKMQAGMNGADAVKQWKQAIQQTVNANASRGPGNPILSGQGGAPPQSKKVTDLSRRETMDLVAQVLEQDSAQRR